jgi:uncharacterized protein (DUF1499 family)
MLLRYARRLIRGVARGLVGAVLVFSIIGYGVINSAGHYAVRWHVDPSTVEPRGTPNEYFVAPRGTTSAPTDADTPLYRESPHALLARFDAIARAQPRTSVVAGDLDSLIVTYVQRSRFIGFPDYVTVKAVKLVGGAGLIVYSRARYGRSDFGVNRARVEAWLGALGPPGGFA